MRIAHLILAHKNPAQLERLLSALRHPQADCYLHIDKKSDVRPFLHLLERDRVFLVHNNVKVYWAAYGTIQATLNSMEEAMAREAYGYLNVLSGQDFPLRSAEDIHGYLLARRGSEFINCITESDGGQWWKQSITRVRSYHFPNWTIPGKYRLAKAANALLPPRMYPLNHELAGRSNWFTVTSDAAGYMIGFLKAHPEVVRFFKYVWGADEFIFSTMLHNSGFGERIRDNQRFVDWSEGNAHPKLLTTGDFDRMIASGKLFARKFDQEEDGGIIDLLEAHIR
jgi:hypothetical protein